MDNFKTALIALALLCLAIAQRAEARNIDRVVAYVDDMAITQRTLEAKYTSMLSTSANLTRFEALSQIIDDMLLVREARRLKLTAPTEAELIEKYIDFKVKALIIVREEEIKEYYEANKPIFKRQKYSEAREKIKKYMENQEKMRRLKHHLGQLRQKATIRVLVEESAP